MQKYSKCNDKYIFRIENGISSIPYNEFAPYAKFCELNKISPSENRFGWMQTTHSYFKQILDREMFQEDVFYKIYEVSKNTKLKKHDFDEYQTFMYYLEEFGVKDEFFSSDEARNCIVNKSEDTLDENSLIQVVFDPSSVVEIFSTKSIDEYLIKINEMGLSEFLCEDYIVPRKQLAYKTWSGYNVF